MTLALGRRELAAHPSPYHGLTCAQTYVRRHVHDASGDVLYPMPDACAACGRQWFAEDEITYMGYCGDCWPGSAMLLDITDGVEAVPATYPQPRRHRAQPARGRATVGNRPVYTFDRLATCSWCGASGEHALDCPYGPVMQYVRRSGH